MLIALLVIAISLALMNPAPTWLGWYIMAFILLFDSAYAWSWGPLGWVYPFGVFLTSSLTTLPAICQRRPLPSILLLSAA